MRGPQQQVELPSQEAVPTDLVEPLQPTDPDVGGQPALPPRPAPIQSLPAISAADFETLVDLSLADLFPEALASSENQPEEIRPSLGLREVLGAAVVAAGGYHLALRPSDRFRARDSEADASQSRRTRTSRRTGELTGDASATIGDGGYPGRWTGALDSQLFQAMPQGVGMQSQDLGRAPGAVNDPVGLMQNCGNVVTFNGLQTGTLIGH